MGGRNSATRTASGAKWIADHANDSYFSSVSVWEVAIKRSSRQRTFRVNPRIFRRGLLENGYLELPVTSQRAIEITSLPPLHKDPFDRILIAQARVEDMVLVTSDGLLASYGDPAQLV